MLKTILFFQLSEVSSNENRKNGEYSEMTSFNNSVALRMILHDFKRQFYTVYLQNNNTLIPGKHYLLSIHYTAHLNNKMKGFYRSHYKDATGKTRQV